MRIAKGSSIRGRLLVRLGVLFAVGMVALYLAASSYARYAADSSYDRLLLGAASSIAETLSVTPSEVLVDIPYAALDMLSAAPDDRVFYRVIGADGATLTGYADLPQPPLASDLTPEAFRDNVRLFNADYRGETVRFAAIGRDIRRTGVSGQVWVQVGQTRTARAELARDLTLRAVLPIVGMTVLAILVVWFSVGQAMRPLEVLGGDLTRREASDLSPLAHHAPREVTPLIDAINAFMGRLDKTIDVLKVFIADAAHQLRTPITALLLQMRAAEASTGADRASSLAEAHRSAERLARLVDQLLGDAMVAHRAQLGHSAVFDLRAVVEQALLDCRPLMEDADVRFSVTATDSQVRGDRVLVSEAIKNIVHNAIRHASDPETGEVRIDIVLARRDNRGILTISDDGPGMSDDALAHVGERFHGSASSSHGTGLGLAIAGEAMGSQGGRMTIANREDQSGLIVTLEFPSA